MVNLEVSESESYKDVTLRVEDAFQDDSDCKRQDRFHHVRYLIIIFGGMTLGAMFFTRLSITVAIMSMVNHTFLYLQEHPNATVEELFPPDYVETGEFNWSNEVQQTITSGYMIAYTIPQVITVRMALKYGIRISIPICLLLCATGCLLTPIMAYWGWQWALFLRLINGLGASAMMSAMINTIERWLPYKDSAKGLSLLQFVQTFLYVACPLITGQLCAVNWKLAFYVPSVFGFLFAFIWVCVVRDNPEFCPFMSRQELALIKGITEDDSVERKEKDIIKKRTDLPWYFMYKMRSFYWFTLMWILYCNTFGGFLFLVPTYFHGVLKLSVEDNGLYNFIIQVGVLFSMLWSNPLSNYLQKRFDISLTSSRRIIALIYTFVTIITWCYVAAYHEHQIIAICINRFFHMTNDTVLTSTLMSKFGKAGLSSMVYSMMNTIGCLSTVFFCWIIGRFLDHTGESLECWSWIFITMSAMNVVLLLVYTFCVDSVPILMEPEKDMKMVNNKE